MLCTEAVPEYNVVVSQNEVAEDGPIIEARIIIDLFSQEPILSTLSIISKEAPIHVNVPNEAVSCLHKLTDEVQPEPPIILIFE